MCCGDKEPILGCRIIWDERSIEHVSCSTASMEVAELLALRHCLADPISARSTKLLRILVSFTTTSQELRNAE